MDTQRAIKATGSNARPRRTSAALTIPAARVRRALADMLAGRNGTLLQGDEWERVVEVAGGCDPIEGMRQYGFLDRWSNAIGYACKTILVSDRATRTGIFEQDGPITRPVEWEWTRINFDPLFVPRFYFRDKEAEADPSLLTRRQLSGAVLAGRALVNEMISRADVSATKHGVSRSLWALLLRHPDGCQFAYSELPVEALDADSMAWHWVEAPGDEEDDESKLIALDGESADGRLIVRWFLTGGHVRVRFQLDPERVVVFTLPARHTAK